jgi:arsenite methyltransferase
MRLTAWKRCVLVAGVVLVGCAELAYQHMNDPKRDAWQKPEKVVEKLTIAPGSRIADIGAGGWYFTWYLAGATGPSGKVYAVEIDETALAIIKKEMASRGITNVMPIRAEPQNAKLPEAVDLVFSCDTYHHMDERVTYFRSLVQSLKANGRIAILDFHSHGFFSSLLGHGTAKEEVQREMGTAGYRLVNDFTFIGSQHFQIFAKKES